jgi:hypothetical protein
MPAVLFVVHGMGVHSDSSWADPVVAQLDRVASRYDHFADGPPFSRQATVVPITYDRHFAGWLDRWSGSADELERTIVEEGIGVPDITGWLRGAGEEARNGFWTHVVDVLLYRFFGSQVATPLRLDVIRQIAAKVDELKTGGQVVETFILAHSMGTAVVHDSLALFAEKPELGANSFFMGGTPVRALFTVANVSRVLERPSPPSFQAYQSVVRPAATEPVQDRRGWIGRFYNFGHELDPFLWVRPFRPVGWADYWQVTELRHVLTYNVHGYVEYLDHPAVHIPIINNVLGGVIPRSEADEKTAGYRPELGGDCEEELHDLVADLHVLREAYRGRTEPLELIKLGAQFYGRVKRAQERCRTELPV